MSNQDVRKEQIALLRFEKDIIKAAESLAACESAAKSMDAKLGSTTGGRSFDEVKSAFHQLVAVTADSHRSLRTESVESNKKTLDQIILAPESWFAFTKAVQSKLATT